MNFAELFYSPSLKPFLERDRSKAGENPRWPVAVYIRYRESRLHEITECAYTAASIRELRARIRELHRVQSSMGLPISVSPEKAERSGTFLSYAPIRGGYKILPDAVVIEATGKKIPLRTTRWIAHEKKKFEF